MSSFVQSYLQSKGIQITDEQNENLGFCCPFHNDTVASARFHQVDEVWKCFACNIGGTIVDFEARLRGCTKEQAKRFLGLLRGSIPSVPESEVDKHHKYLVRDNDLLARLVKERAISRELVDRYKIGWEPSDPGRLWVPIKFGEFYAGVKRWDVFYRDAGEVEREKRRSRKFLPYKKGFGSDWLFPYDTLDDSYVLVTEGEGDCLSAIGLGYKATTAGSASSDLLDHIEYLTGKMILICYDVDDAGRKGAADNAKKLADLGETVKVLDLTKLGASEKMDLTDCVLMGLVNKTSMDALIEETPLVTKSEVAEDTEVEKDEVPLIDFEEYIEERYHNRVVSLPAIVVGQDEICKRVPKSVAIVCRRERTGKCHFCPFSAGEITASIDPMLKTEKFLAFYYGSDKGERELIKDYFGALCDGFSYKASNDKQNITKVVLIPNTVFKVSSQVSVAYGFTSITGCEFNHSYQITAKVITNPKNNDINLYVVKVEPSEAFAVQITPKFLQEHKIFQPEEKHVQPEKPQRDPDNA